jgi:hypothetical protein
MLTGEPPFCDSLECRLEDKIKNQEVTFPRWISQPAVSRVSMFKIKAEKSEGARERGYDILAFP